MPVDKVKGKDGIPEAVPREPSPADGIPLLARGTEGHVGDTRRYGRSARRATTNHEDTSASVTMPNVVVLAIVGNPESYASTLEWIQRRGMIVEVASTAEEGLRLHRDHGADLVLLGLPLPDQLAAPVIAGVRGHDPRATIVVVGKDEDIASHIAAVDLGAQEYVADPIDGRRDLLFALGVSLGVRRSDAHFRVLRTREASAAAWRRIVASSPPMVEVMKRLRELCEWTASGAAPSVLLTGARGTGKRTLAKALHYNGARRNRAFVEISCATSDPATLRADLFGTIHGAARQGVLEVADGGTVYLDGIEAMPSGIQRDLLTAIEGRQICRVGALEPIYIDVQVVAATRGDLDALVKRNEFRLDLYHRLSVRTIDLPPLRDRGGDILAIAESLLAVLAPAYGASVPQLHEDAAIALLGHAWPGNIHELRNELEHVLLHVAEPLVRAEHLLFPRGSGAVAADSTTGHLNVTLAGTHCSLDRLEQEVIRQALARNGGNISRTARFLAITRQTLLYRLKKHGLRVPTSADPEDR